MFEKKGLDYGATEFLMLINVVHHLEGITHIEDDDRKLMDLSFTRTRQFDIPKAAFILQQNNQMTPLELIVFSYLCYVADKTKSLHVKIVPKFVKERLKIQPYQFEQAIERLFKAEYQPLFSRISADNEFYISSLEPELIESVETMYSLLDQDTMDELSEESLLFKVAFSKELKLDERYVLTDFLPIEYGE